MLRFIFYILLIICTKDYKNSSNQINYIRFGTVQPAIIDVPEESTEGVRFSFRVLASSLTRLDKIIVAILICWMFILIIKIFIIALYKNKVKINFEGVIEQDSAI